MVITEENCFYPDAVVYFDPEQRGYRKRAMRIDQRIHAWVVESPQAPQRRGTVVHLHGNAENMTSHIVGVLFLLDLGYTLVTFDYRGYGHTPGLPTLAGIQLDAAAVLRHILARPDEFGEVLFGFGQSMGAYTLARILPDFPLLKGAILEAGLTSFYDLFSQHYPHIPCTVPHEGLSALDTLPLSPVPKLFIHGTHDEVVPYHHSLAMYACAREPKLIEILEGVGHLGAEVSPLSFHYRDAIRQFLEA